MLNEAARYTGVLRVEAQLHAKTAVLQGKEQMSIGQEDRVGSLPAFILWRRWGRGIVTYTESQILIRPTCSSITLLNEMSRLQIKVFVCQT
jgi:hypothetical protein